MAINWDALVVGPVHGAFGESVTYLQVATGATTTITDGIPSRAYVEVDSGGGMVGTTALRTCLRVRDSTLGFTPVDGDLVTFRGQTWKVTDERPDGMGNTLLVLSVPGRSEE